MNSFEDVKQSKSKRVKPRQKVGSLHQSKILHFIFTVTLFTFKKVQVTSKMLPKEIEKFQQPLVSVFLSRFEEVKVFCFVKEKYRTN